MNSENILRQILFLFSGVLISLHDIKTKKIYVVLSYFCLATHLLSQLNDLNKFIFSLLGGLVLFLEYYFVRIITRKSLGMGDVHYSLYCGAFATLNGIIQSTLICSLLCILYFLVIYFVSKNGSRKYRKAIPFAPFMFGGTVLFCLVRQFSTCQM